MLTIINTIESVPYFQIMDVYLQSNTASGLRYYPSLTKKEQLVAAEQELYTYLADVFFKTKGAFIAGWTCIGQLVSALRMEPYGDGYLLNALETHPEYRGKGYGGCLVAETLKYFRAYSQAPVYSHVDKHNTASLKVHDRAGFVPVKDYAVKLDGSRTDAEITLLYK